VSPIAIRVEALTVPPANGTDEGEQTLRARVEAALGRVLDRRESAIVAREVARAVAAALAERR
jgi:predicted glycosyltransferase